MSGPGMSMPAFSRMAPMGLPVAIDTAERAEPRVAWPGRALPAKPWTTAASSIAMIPSIGGGTLIPKGWQAANSRSRACARALCYIPLR